MLSAILATKLFIPPPPPKVVFRPRLIELLNKGMSADRTPGVTLISAPAGCGKTTLISEWVAACNCQVAWLSLDEGDSDLTRFLTYLIAALRTIAPNIGEDVLGMLQSSQPPPAEPVLTALINEIAAIPGNFFLVLDDYHMVDAKPVDLALTFLLEHLPPQMHLVITTREDPQLPLARLRSRGRLTELRAADLRFNPAEAAEFLHQVMSLNLSAADSAALEDRTEGWIAGLQLAALSMQGQPDIPGFIRTFAGDHRYIVDYLVEEVLQRQPETVRSFLLQTAILDRLNGPLCDAVTGQADSSARLEALQRGNFFVVPLDDRRHWYRYHHLFAEVLRLHLMAEQADQVAALHRRASQWYEHNGFAADAIRHALAGNDFERGANLVEQIFQTMSRTRQEVTMLEWLKALPEALVRDHPVLCNLYAGVLMQTGQIQGVETWLLAAEHWLILTDNGRKWPEAASAKMVVADKEEFRRLPGAVAVHRAGLALLQGNAAGTMEYARKAHDLAPEDDFLRRGGAATLMGLAYWTNGDLEAAQQLYVEGMAWLRQAGNISDMIGCTIALADIYLAQGRLRQSMLTYEQALQLAAEHGTPTMRGTADMLVGMSGLYREQNDLPAAIQYLVRSKEQGEHTGLPQNPYRWRVAMARVCAAQGDLDGALGLLKEAERLYMSDFSPNVRPVSASKTRVWVAQGRLGEALDWAQKQGLSVEDTPVYLREFEHITLARILLARYRSDRSDRAMLELLALLERLLKAAQAGGRAGSAIEILLLQALAHKAQGNLPAALLPLHRALALAEPEGYVRMFVDEGEPVRLLLEAYRLKRADGSFAIDATQSAKLLLYTEKLLQSFSTPQTAIPPPPPSLPTIENRKSTIENFVEPLSQRELEILRLFKTELSGPEIAQKLVIALSTVRTHTKSIFSKLGVNNRRAAVKRAEELDLI